MNPSTRWQAAALSSRFDIDPIGQPASPWTTSEWLNSDVKLQPADLLGKVLVVHAFQMLCPACVQRGLPQVQRIQQLFSPQDVAVIGLHTVFEHHAAMTVVSLRAFVHEYRISFPIGVDAHQAGADDPIPITMRAYRLQGTPSLLLIDRAGRLRRHSFGAEDDLLVGAAIATLLAEAG